MILFVQKRGKGSQESDVKTSEEGRVIPKKRKLYYVYSDRHNDDTEDLGDEVGHSVPFKRIRRRVRRSTYGLTQHVLIGRSTTLGGVCVGRGSLKC